MNNRTVALLIAASAVCFFVLAGPSFAGGLYVPTFGGPSQGTACISPCITPTTSPAVCGPT